MANTDNTRTICQFNIADDGEVTIRMRGTSRRIKAQALDVQRDSGGRLTYVCLDRLIHRQVEDTFLTAVDSPGELATASQVHVSGCFATELTVASLSP